ncbi:MAG: hypothetical protein CMH54_03760 [Myxococcales bacterium]|nr:hypothetical protein [Myxococcales bacterium]
MNRKLVILLLVFGGLLFVVMSRPGKRSSDAGTHGGIESLETEAKQAGESQTLFQTNVRVIEVRKGDRVIRLERTSDRGTDWEIVKPITGLASYQKVRGILDLFQTDVVPQVVEDLTEQNSRSFGFVGRDTLELILESDGAERTHLKIGVTDLETTRGSEDVTERTWVTRVGVKRPQALLVTVPGLRSILDVPVARYRSKRLIPAREWTDIDSVTIQNPEHAGGVIEIVRDATDDDPNRWRFKSPADRRLGNPRSYFSRLTALRAQKVHARASMGDIGHSQEGKVATLEVNIGDKKIRMHIGPRQDAYCYVTVDGRPDDVYELGIHQRPQILPTTDALRDKQVFPFETEEDIQKIETFMNDEPRLALQPSEAGWVRIPDGELAEPSQVDLLVNTILRLEVKEYVPGVSLQDAGLVTPSLRLKVTGRQGSFEVVFGEDSKKNVHARRVDRNDIFVVAKYIQEKLATGWQDLENRSLFFWKSGDLETILITHPDGQVVHLTTKGDESRVWKLVDGAKEYPMDQPTIRRIAAQAATLRVREKRPELKNPKDTPGVTRILIRGIEGKEGQVFVGPRRPNGGHLVGCDGCYFSDVPFILSAEKLAGILKRKETLLSNRP